jgi:hypothetical protein
LAANFGVPDHEIAKILNLIRKREEESEKLGTATLEAEVANISRHGFSGFSLFPWQGISVLARMDCV